MKVNDYDRTWAEMKDPTALDYLKWACTAGCMCAAARSFAIKTADTRNKVTPELMVFLDTFATCRANGVEQRLLRKLQHRFPELHLREIPGTCPTCSGTGKSTWGGSCYMCSGSKNTNLWGYDAPE
jgi:hypothetical protein